MLFEQIEKTIFAEACAYARETTKTILEKYDVELMKGRDTKKYKLRTIQNSTVKTIFGEVEYRRRYYDYLNEEGEIEKIFLLDNVLQMKAVGSFSENLAKIVAEAASQMSYRQAAEKIRSMTGITISHGGVWNIVQALGNHVQEDETVLVKAMKGDRLHGEIETEILFEEMDGVYLSIQGRDRKRYRKRKQEMKVALAYRGWKQDGKKRKLIDKVMTAGFYSTTDFHTLREAEIRKVYNTDEINYRILNGDGAAWIKDTYEADTIYQLDRFHIEQEITCCVPDRQMQNEIRRRLKEGKIEECLDYIATYANSIDGIEGAEKALENVRKLYSYLYNNKEGLLPYTQRGLALPTPPEGIDYHCNLGTQENHNYSVITRRMKNNRTSWSLRGANNMAKLLTQRENGTLEQTIRHCTAHELCLPEITEEGIFHILSASKAPRKDGKGIMSEPVHVPIQDWKQTPNIKAILLTIGL